MYKRFAFLTVSVFAVMSASNADVSGYFLPNTVVPNACNGLDIGVYDGTVTMVPVYEDTVYNCMPGYYLPRGAEECALCPANSYCAGGEYTYSDTMDSGIGSCASGLIAPSGMWQVEQCGHALHIGDATLYLRQTKQTEHALHVQSDDNIFYGNATTADVPMNENTTHRLKVLYNDVIYSIYDDTVTVEQ